MRQSGSREVIPCCWNANSHSSVVACFAVRRIEPFFPDRGFEPHRPGNQKKKRPPFSGGRFLCNSLNMNGGEGGIRTHGDLRLGGFQDRCIRPLCHLSALPANRRKFLQWRETD